MSQSDCPAGKHSYRLMFLQFNARTELDGTPWPSREPWYEFECSWCYHREHVAKSKFGAGCPW